MVPGLKHGSRHGNVLELTFTTLLAISGDDKLVIFSYFSQKTGFDISCESSPKETICMKCQNLFSGEKKKKKNSVCRLLKILPRVLSVKDIDSFISIYFYMKI